MRIEIYMHGKKISRKTACKIYDENTIKRRIQDAIETYEDDPLTTCDWMDGMEIKVYG